MLVPAGRSSSVRLRIEVDGLVQGVGFRPFVHALAHELGLSGHVANTPDGVLVEVEGRAPAVDQVPARIRTHPPALAAVDAVRVRRVPVRGGTEFTIHSSGAGPGRTYVAPDTATCDDCLRELGDPADRRHRHAFISCTNCGPRFTMVTGLPYDRPTTTMAAFPLCPACSREYADPGDRRFHAQSVCCHDCGPRLSLLTDGAGEPQPARDDQALQQARRLLRDGAVVAVKGLGGYHLACDAENATAVATLRKRKQRGDKPFAVMVGSTAIAAQVARLGPAELAVLAGHQRPIVLLERHTEADTEIPLAEAVAPGGPDLGVMLAYTPVHHLLLGLGDAEHRAADVCRVLVMTSGNVAGEPIVTDDADARTRLAGIADAWLTHDRPIHVPCDDSVVRVVTGTELPVRRSRGYAPLPVHLPFRCPPTLAVGGDLKNTFCLGEGRRAWMSAHVGDMDDYRTQRAFTGAVAHLEDLTGTAPTALVSDLHPGYRSRRWAAERAAEQALPLAAVQHHHAHVASTLVDAGHDGSSPVLGIAFDGTGYGPDGAVWGGEFLIADYASFQRVAHLAYVALPGGDAAVRNPYRMALSHLMAAGIAWEESLPPVRACAPDHRGAPDERSLLARQLGTGLGCVPTSSMGRLFDAVASLTGVRHRVGYEAQAAIELEGLARRAPDAPGYTFADPDDTGAVDCAPVVGEVAADVLAGVAPAVVAARFHRAVVDLTVTVASRARDEHGVDEVTLSGGVFVNAVLTSGCQRALRNAGFRVLRHRRVPPTDAGLALGQLAVHTHRPPADREQAASPPETEPACV